MKSNSNKTHVDTKGGSQRRGKQSQSTQRKQSRSRSGSMSNSNGKASNGK